MAAPTWVSPSDVTLAAHVALVPTPSSRSALATPARSARPTRGSSTSSSHCTPATAATASMPVASIARVTRWSAGLVAVMRAPARTSAASETASTDARRALTRNVPSGWWSRDPGPRLGRPTERFSRAAEVVAAGRAASSSRRGETFDGARRTRPSTWADADPPAKGASPATTARAATSTARRTTWCPCSNARSLQAATPPAAALPGYFDLLGRRVEDFCPERPRRGRGGTVPVPPASRIGRHRTSPWRWSEPTTGDVVADAA